MANDDSREEYDAMRDASKSKKSRNLKSSTAILVSNGIKFKSRNNGVHLIIDDKIDFWPSTGKWIVRKSNLSGRGVKELLNYIKNSK